MQYYSKNNPLLHALVALVFYSVGNASAGVTVIYDSGDTRPNGVVMAEDIRIDKKEMADKIANVGFPVVSDVWKAGSFELVPKGLPSLPIPFFIVACDEVSRAWIDFRREALKGLQAVGYVISCPSRDEYELFEKFADPIPLSPAQGQELADKLGHSIYPAIISRTTIEQ